MDPASEPRARIAFGRFQVLPDRREVLADGQPVKLGGRAFDVLLALRFRQSSCRKCSLRSDGRA
jgi:DNA-binding winged helix-turn-helix (wHTH) protein